MEIPTSVRKHQCKWCTHVSWHRISFKALFVLSLFLCVGTATVSAECGCHKALGSMRFRMLHLISSISPVSRGARQQPRESQHPVEQSWLTWCCLRGLHSLSHRHSLQACKTMRNQSADRYTKLQSLWMTTVHERRSGSPGLALSTNSFPSRLKALSQLSVRAS